jgi:hypothetical protein
VIGFAQNMSSDLSVTETLVLDLFFVKFVWDLRFLIGGYLINPTFVVFLSITEQKISSLACFELFLA